jgi:hypothetical protein
MVNTIDSLAPVQWQSARTPAPATPGAWRDWIARVWPLRTADIARCDDLAELDAHTLADIGAPQRLLDHALARGERQRQEREGLSFGLAAGAWHHW